MLRDATGQREAFLGLGRSLLGFVQTSPEREQLNLECSSSGRHTEGIDCMVSLLLMVHQLQECFHEVWRASLITAL